MKYLLILLLFAAAPESQLIFDFNNAEQLSGWYVVDDVVMGGRSQGDLYINEAGHGVFSGKVSLENNGGFSSVRYNFNEKDVSGFDKVTIRLKGDGKCYQFRVKSTAGDRHSYIAYFDTNRDWQTIEIPLSDLYPSWRGMKLSMPDYPGETMTELAFLIANKKSETFRLEIDKITLDTDR